MFILSQAKDYIQVSSLVENQQYLEYLLNQKFGYRINTTQKFLLKYRFSHITCRLLSSGTCRSVTSSIKRRLNYTCESLTTFRFSPLSSCHNYVSLPIYDKRYTSYFFVVLYTKFGALR